MTTIIITILLSCISWAGEPSLKILKPRPKRENIQQNSSTFNTRPSSKKNKETNDPFAKLQEQNEKLIVQLGQYQSNPAIWDFTTEYNF